jgi:YtoQ family protein
MRLTSGEKKLRPGALLAALRERAGFKTQTALAEKLNRTPGEISNLENERDHIGATRAIWLAEFFGVNADDFLRARRNCTSTGQTEKRLMPMAENSRSGSMSDTKWNVYLSGEIHSDWRERLVEAVERAGLAVTFSGPVTDHGASDDCGVSILGEEDDDFWKDQKGAKLNAIRTRSLIEKADVVVVRFGDKYKQWNAAFDAGCAAALGKPIVTLHSPDLNHALKEVDAAALAIAENTGQIARILQYVIEGGLDQPAKGKIGFV